MCVSVFSHNFGTRVVNPNTIQHKHKRTTHKQQNKFYYF